ncbi:beta subunit of N-acylethanolamine-hydrolyzing acid amidase-domain-containing protein [Penicillium angulare]|uniref:beta subunit of N-acylethanolamine-hydrolyzing acid amidase-domain-containing protein n=1 Tax=Penicillium angulare TaxID=116970 RepID=UPI00253FD97A|nr:beta subunit of N-acylethanolamine-hydrolyzing acid amidase-domain-containing protein [Penicillium angulare]KAJ5280348.1 beta subunit of N-acylethanolamine-hydrolyzing acid amidase-domain-containing protein [Penicillium angulare]
MEHSVNLSRLGAKPPVFRINLSLPPKERYVSIATLYRDRMRSLRGMFDDLVTSLSPRIPVNYVHKIAWLCLHRLYTSEETQELRGISQATDIDMYLLICLNTVLDLLMGCTSGGVRVKSKSSETKMMHFRTLDWGMDPLRDLIVQLDFVRDSDSENVLATSVTYVGFVGVLTGVRKDLSASLNFRPVHDTTRNFAFYANHLFVLLGLRQSISSLLRQCILLPPTQNNERSKFSTLADIVANVPHMATTAAYLIFSNGSTTVTMEKDHRTAVVRSSSSFIVTTNHDQGSDSMSPEAVADAKRQNHFGLTLVASDGQDITDIIEDSNERHDCIQMRWNREVREQNELANPVSITKESLSFAEPPGSRTSLRLRKRREEEERLEEAKRKQIVSLDLDDDSDITITKSQLVNWLTTFPVLNETTHYATIMDPSLGKLAWVRRYDTSEWDDDDEN